MSDQVEGLTLTEVATEVRLDRATARRLLLTLEQLGYVGRVGNRFVLAPRTLRLGYAALSSTPLWKLVAPFAREVADRTNESCSIGILDGDEVLYIASEQSARRILGLQIASGIRLPAYCTSIGRLLLSGAAESWLGDYLDRVPLMAHTPSTITSRRRLVAEIGRTGRQGWALVVDELEEGQSSVAVPLYGPDGGVVAAMNVSAQSPRLEARPTVEAVLDVLREVAASIEVTLRARLRLAPRSDGPTYQARGARSASR